MSDKSKAEQVSTPEPQAQCEIMLQKIAALNPAGLSDVFMNAFSAGWKFAAKHYAVSQSAVPPQCPTCGSDNPEIADLKKEHIEWRVPDPALCDNQHSHPKLCHCLDPLYWKQCAEESSAQLKAAQEEIANLTKEREECIVELRKYLNQVEGETVRGGIRNFAQAMFGREEEIEQLSAQLKTAQQELDADLRDWNKLAGELGCDSTREAMSKTVVQLKAASSMVGQLAKALKMAKGVLEIVEREAPGYDWNADRLSLTLMTGEVYQQAESLLSNPAVKT